MPRISDAIRHRVIDATDIVTLISSYVKLQKAGRNFKGCCPFHPEKTPSFHVYPDKQIFRCYGGGCGKWGNAITFVMEYEKAGYAEAVRALAQKAGIVIPDETPQGRDQSDRSRAEDYERESVIMANEAAQAFFVETLSGPGPEALKARAYLEGRGFSRADIERFKWGLAPSGWDGLARMINATGKPVDSFLKASLIREGRHGHYDFFRGRVMVPILSPSGRVLGFGGRVFDSPASDGRGGDEGRQDPKYLNSPETPVFSKGKVLFGLDHAKGAIRQTESVVIVEGYMDRMALAARGLENAVAVLGTALTEDHVRLLAPLAKEFFLFFDSDRAGVVAAERSLEIFHALGHSPKVVSLEGYKDVDEYLAAGNAVDMDWISSHSRDAFDFLADRVAASAGSGVDFKVAMAEGLAGFIAAESSIVRRQAYIDKLSGIIGMDPSIVEREVGRARPGMKKNFTTGAADSEINSAPESLAADTIETTLLAMMIHDEVGPEARNRVDPEVFQSPVFRDMALEIISSEGTGTLDSRTFIANGTGKPGFDSVFEAWAGLSEDGKQLRKGLSQTLDRAWRRVLGDQLAALRDRIRDLARDGIPKTREDMELVSALSKEREEIKKRYKELSKEAGT